MSQFDQFREFIADFGQSAWLIIAVKASLEKTTAALHQIIGGRVTHNVALELPEKHGLVGAYIPLLQTKDCEWTLIIHSLGDWCDFEEQTKLLSKQLKTRVLTYEAEDTSGAEDMILWEKGKKKLKYLTEEQSEYQDELMAEARESDEEAWEEIDEADGPVEIETEIVADYGEVFAKLAINPVGVYATPKGKVAVSNNFIAQIERVDLIKI